MGNTTMTQVPAGIAAFYDKNLLMRAVPYFVHDKFGQARNLGVSDITAKVVQYGDFVTLTDKIAMHVEDNVVKEATDILGDQAGLTLDTVWRDAVVPNIANATILTVAGATAVETGLVAADIITVKAMDVSILTLKKNLAKKFTGIITGSTGVGTSPVRASYMSIIHPDVIYDLEGITAYKNVSEYASQGNVQEGEVGSYKDIRFIESTQGYINTDGGDTNVDTYHTPIFGKEGYGVVSLRGKRKFETFVKALGSGGTSDPINQRSTVGWKASTVAKVLNDAYMCSIISSSSQGDN